MNLVPLSGALLIVAFAQVSGPLARSISLLLTVRALRSLPSFRRLATEHFFFCIKLELSICCTIERCGLLSAVSCDVINSELVNE